MKLRALVFDVAHGVPNPGPVSETLKWGQPSYAVRTGTPLRLGVTKSGLPAMLVHCQTTVIADARSVFDGDLRFEGNRAVVIPPNAVFPEAALRQVIHAAVTYRVKA
ncbi:DUF1801 domain-containing protein [uncultured Marivita sp.]|uniref:DUF1801 domain-containing protein n=1 Tax=uncultured Marivita sp. TaxID=888080 RepID=UPI00260BDE5F|nr:DUF1801 domain-containing protein [uncultured Marivita sp.]